MVLVVVMVVVVLVTVLLLVVLLVLLVVVVVMVVVVVVVGRVSQTVADVLVGDRKEGERGNGGTRGPISRQRSHCIVSPAPLSLMVT